MEAIEPIKNDGTPKVQDQIMGRLREAQNLLGSIDRVNGTADIDLLTAEQALRRVIVKLGD